MIPTFKSSLATGANPVSSGCGSGVGVGVGAGWLQPVSAKTVINARARISNLDNFFIL
jgi:hypothetical protein